ncbi:MAG: bifunctional (p)ppGpp synthetase/guanosine-3',5'-bis(diphosphate) 3'-pyrophosphohydrolase [Oscillospiraceae bacterium]|nr:bifunctional (p)ppGpp synthetase/guanosine-3',5'-bis(diphosphate) 3'-pyrophosphohydrolase [Oscillospiraceae bacterium]MBR4656456.1 bifunctional (p)ppGpp synthetase/guanosine-3',5'-bis(diphosphate) 3'-pyrophosphohydrolase [Oscillospiraceae bacterium]
METFEQHYNAMMEAIRTYVPNTDLDQVERAVQYATEKHKDQKRKDGSPYIIHPLAVAEIVAEIGLDTDAIVAALLHDCIEDTSASFDEISRIFGKTVAELVEGVTKLTRVEFSTLEEQQVENLRKMFMAMSKDIRVVLIKICDRLHNQRTMEYQSKPKQVSKSMETMDIYAPLAHRLGMQKIKWELEDSALQYLDPEGYKELVDYLDAHHDEAEAFMQEIREKISARLEAVGISCEITSRIKHVYSIYRKMKEQNKSLDELYDLYAFRVIVDSISDCYNVLGHIHEMFKLVPGRFKDYISTPKPNNYQSLHTTVIGDEGIPFEVQIRTKEMHEIAENGIAAHWKYKEGIGAGEGKEFDWIRRLLEDQQETDAEDYIHSLKVDMFDDEVFVFSPRGKVISLPAGSTPIDFAYAIHSGVGNTMIGAKVNNRIAGYDVKLHNGDIVEILTSKSAKGPSRDWLNICKSNQARSKIKQWFKREKREENIARGKTSFEGELRRINISPTLLQDPELQPLLLRKLSFDSLDDMYAAIGYGGITSIKAMGKIREDLLKASRAPAAPKETKVLEIAQPVQQDRHGNSGVIVEDIDSCMIKFSRCCTPVPGDDIVGFITKGYGVSIHRRDCPNARAANNPDMAARWVNVSWVTSGEKPFATTLEVLSQDRDGLLLDVSSALTTQQIRMKEINGKELPGGRCQFTVTFEVKGLEQLTNVMNRLRSIEGVVEVKRGQN